jgi:hypothetical protein
MNPVDSTNNYSINATRMTSLLKYYHGFSIEEISSFFRLLPKDLPIVSVGSGRGELEKSLSHHMPELKIITVDPDPYSYTPKDSSQLECEGKLPDYDDVASLMYDQPSIKRECVLLIPWAFPNKSYYDYDALLDLEPKYVITIYEVIGGACGADFHDWLNTIETDEILSFATPHELCKKPKDNYQLCSIWKNYASNRLVIEGIVMLSRSDVKCIDNGNMKRGLSPDETETEFVDEALRRSCVIC